MSSSTPSTSTFTAADNLHTLSLRELISLARSYSLLPADSSLPTGDKQHYIELIRQYRVKEAVSATSAAISSASTMAAASASSIESDTQILQQHKYSSSSIAPITSNLFLSCVTPAEDLSLLTSLHITHILNLTGYRKGSTSELRFPSKFPDKFKYLQIPIADENDAETVGMMEEQFFRPGLEFMREALESSSQQTPHQHRNRVLVHCEAGISRSSTMMIAYLMTSPAHKLSLYPAYQLVTSKKPNISPNNAFFKQLQKIERHLISKERAVPIESAISSYTLEDYLTDQLLKGVAQGMDRMKVHRALQRANYEPNTASMYLLDGV